MLKRGFSFAPGYRLEQFLGRGQFGQVWRTSGPGGTATAVKFIDLSGGEGAKEHEGIKRVNQIRHANLMPITAIWLLDVHGQAIEDGPDVSQETMNLPPMPDPMATADSLPAISSPHISMPGPLEATGMLVSPQPEAAWLAVAMLLGGKSLQHRLRECVKNGLPGIPPKELISYMDESAKGLDFLNIPQHDLGEGLVAIQHCDVKPANIVLIGSSAVVCDFGLARILTRNQVTATSAAGTPAYMAPEAIAGRPSKTSDQYSLAVTYYHLRTGTLPVNDGTLWEVLDAHRTGKLDLSRVPEHEQAVLKRATALQWEERFESNLDFVESLRDALRSEGFTRPIMMPSQTTDFVGKPTAEIDPSVTLVPGVSLDGSTDTALGPRVQTAVNGANEDTKPTGAPVHAIAPALIDTTSQPAWWLQPKWLATGGAAIGVPLILAIAMSLGGSEPEVSSGGNGAGPVVVTPPDPGTDPQPIVVPEKTASDWLAEVVTQLPNDRSAAQKAFDAAAKLEPSLMIPQPFLMTGHKNQVIQVEFAENGGQLISVADDSSPFVWPTASIAGRAIGQAGPPLNNVKLAGANQQINVFAVDPSGKFVAVADTSGGLFTTQFSDLSKPLHNKSLESTEAISIAFHPSEPYLVAATIAPSSIVVMTRGASRGVGSAAFDVVDPIDRVMFDTSGRWLLILDESGMVSQLDWSEIKLVFDVAAAPTPVPVTSQGTRVMRMLATIGQSAAESVLVTGGEDGEVTLRSVGANSKVLALQSEMHNNPISSLAVSALGLAGPIASGDDFGNLAIWRADTQSPIARKPAHGAAISALALTDDGLWLAAASLDGTVTLWDLSAPDPALARLTANLGQANTLAIDPAQRFIAVGHDNGVIALWDLRHVKMLIGKTVEPTKPTNSPAAKNDKSI